MAKSSKTVNSLVALWHLGLLDHLERHAEKQRMGHTNDVRRRNGLELLPPKTALLDDEDPTTKALDSEDEDRELLVIDDLGLIAGLRLYDRQPDGSPVGRSVSGEEFVATHCRIRRERETYRELDSKMVRVGEVVSIRRGRDMEALNNDYTESRTERERRAPGVLKSIMVRCMPHEAEIAGPLLSPDALNAVMDRAAAEFVAETGCEIISVVVHRMNNGDLHVHIQYTMVIGILESKCMLGRRGLKAWKVTAGQLAREALRADGVDNPNPSAIGAKKNRLVAEGKLAPAPEAQIEYRKFKGLRSLREGSILGYSFRQKLNLVRLAEDAGDPILADRVINLNDGRARFRPIAKRGDSDLEKKYLDLWLERTWRNLVKAVLPEEALGKIRVAGVVAARNYADYGTVMVEPSHLKRRMLELEKEAYEAELMRAYDAYENEQFRREVEDSAQQKIAMMEQQVAMLRESVEAAEKSAEAAKLAEAAAQRRVAAMKEQVAKFGNSVEEAEKSAESAKLDEVAALRRVELMEEQVTQFGNSAEEAKKSAELAKLAEAAALRQFEAIEEQVAQLGNFAEGATLAEKIKQFTSSTKDIADILTLIQVILDNPTVRAVLETIDDLWKAIVDLGERVGLQFGNCEPESKKKVKPKDEEMQME